MPCVEISVDLDLSRTMVTTTDTGWTSQEQTFPYLDVCKDNTVYFWDQTHFSPVSRYESSLIKLIPTPWGAPTFQIDGVKMLPTEHLSPYEDARQKVSLIKPRHKRILETCGGLGYFAAWCLKMEAHSILSCEKNPDVVWLREINPWSPPTGGRLELVVGDAAQQILHLPANSFDAILHDPPRFALAGELYGQFFYDQLARVLKPHGKLFHYTGSPNRLTSGRNVPQEVTKRLQTAGFSVDAVGDGLLATLRGVNIK